MGKSSSFLLSVIVPVFNEEESITPLINKLIPIISDYSYEVLFINDGSRDKTEEAIKTYARENNKIKLISFTRNFSHQSALTCGYAHAQGDCVITIDADLQDPPELIRDMIEKWREGFKVVYAKREYRDESFFKKTTATAFYKLINILSNTPIPQNVGDYRLVDRDVVTLLNSMPEKERFLRGLVAWGGYPAAYVGFDRKKREHGETHYPFSKMLSFALSGIMSFSNKPLRLASYLGVVTSVVGLIGIFYAIYRRIFLPEAYWVPGWTATFTAIMFFGGVQLLTIGIIGEYIGKLFTEVQGRPQYVIKEKINV